MEKTMKKLFLAVLMMVNIFALSIGEKPKKVILENEDGGYVKDGSSWSSEMIKDKIYVMFYVDPDEKDKNERVAQALKKKHFDRSKYGSIAIINMAATWKPNFIIQKILESKQKKYEDTIYVMDQNKVLVDKWGLADDESDILLFDKDGSVLFYKAGRLSDEDIGKLIHIIEVKINEEQA